MLKHGETRAGILISSPVLHKDRVYTTIKTGELFCNDAESGKTIWIVKLAPDQIHAAPTWRTANFMCRCLMVICSLLKIKVTLNNLMR